jgi:serine/threonine protein kinase
MPGLYLNGVSAPDEIKASLQQLSKSIEFVKEDNKAANGYVFFGKNRVTNVDVAVKFYYWGGKHTFHAEPKQLAAIKSDYVLPIYDAGLIDNTWAYFQTPFCVNGDLDDLLEHTSVGNLAAIDYSYQVLSGLSHLHAKRFLHRDLKPANVYVDERNNAVIGDFGSVKRLPEGHGTIPASSHSILYRPPETNTANVYGIPGDIYQAGILLYQLLGGYLTYDLVAYLSRTEQQRLKSLGSPADESIFIDQCIKSLICSGKLLNYASMPPWVPEELKKIIKKACHLDPTKRFQTASSFMAKLHAVRPKVLDWKVVDGHPQLCSGNVSFRIVGDAEQCRVQKKRGENWRNDNSFGDGSMPTLVSAILQGLC